MAKDMISTAEVAAKLGMTTAGVRMVVKRGELEAHQEGDSERSPLFFKRSEVTALVEKRKGNILDEPKAPKKKTAAIVKAAPQTMRRKASPPPTARAPKISVASPNGSVVAGALREDVITLVRVVDRGWMSQDEAFAKLRELAESL